MTIELWTWNTPNGRKISVALEEMGLPYKVVPINISKGEQFKPEFLKISPNNRIPTIIDSDDPRKAADGRADGARFAPADYPDYRRVGRRRLGQDD